MKRRSFLEIAACASIAAIALPRPAFAATRIDVYKVAGWGLVDEVIDQRDTRRAIAWGLELAKNKKVEGPKRRRGIIPV